MAKRKLWVGIREVWINSIPVEIESSGDSAKDDLMAREEAARLVPNLEHNLEFSHALGSDLWTVDAEKENVFTEGA